MSSPRFAFLAAVGVALLAAALAASVGAIPAGGDPLETEGPTGVDDSNVTVTNATVLTGPPGIGDRLTSLADIRHARTSGDLIRDATVVRNGTFVLELRAPGLDRRLASVEGPNETVRFFRATHGENSTIRFEQTDEPGTHSPWVALRLNSTAATTVVTDAANDRYYLVVDAENLRYGTTWSTDSPVEWRTTPPGHVLSNPQGFGLNATIDGRSWTFSGEGRWNDLEPIVSFDRSELDFAVDGYRTPDDDRSFLLVERRPNERVRIHTSFVPGTNVTVRLTNRSDGGPPLTATVSVAGEGHDIDDITGLTTPSHRASARLNTTGLDPNATFDLEVAADGRTFDRARGHVRAQTVWAGPEPLRAELTSVDAVRAAERADRLTRDRSVTLNDTLVVELLLPGVADRMASAEGATTTGRFFRALDDAGVSIRFEERDSRSGLDPLSARPDPASTRVVPDHENDTFFLVVRPAEMQLGWGTDDDVDWGGVDPLWLEANGAFALDVSARENATTGALGHRYRSPSVQFREAVAAFDDRHAPPETASADVAVNRSAAAPIHVETTLPPGARLTVRIDNRSDGGPTLAATATVAPGGDTGTSGDRPEHDATASLNTTGLAPNATFDLAVVARGRVLTRRPGIARPNGDPPPPDGTESTSTSAPEPTATPREATATPTRTDPAPTSASAPTPTATPDRSTGTGVPATATSQPTPTGDSSTETESEVDGTTGGTPETTRGGTATTGDSGPGFGPLAAFAAVAVLAVAMLLRNR